MKWERVVAYAYSELVGVVSDVYSPLSNLSMGKIIKPENKVGIPITTPENTEVPPRCRAYSLEEDTMIKKDI